MKEITEEPYATAGGTAAELYAAHGHGSWEDVLGIAEAEKAATGVLHKNRCCVAFPSHAAWPWKILLCV